FTELVTIDRDVTIRGEEQEQTIVDGSGTGTVFTIISGTVTIKNVTIQNGGHLLGGGGIFNQGTLTVKDSTVTGNNAQVGGGIYTQIGALTLQNSTVMDNNALVNGGGIYNSGSTLTVKDSTIADNQAGTDGGGIFIFHCILCGTVTLRDVT